MAERTIVIRPLGLVTQPSKLGQFPDGAMSQAKDVIIRAPGIVQQAYSKTAAWATRTNRPHLLHSTLHRLIALYRSSGVWSCEWVVPSLTAPTFSSGQLPYTTDDFSQTGRLQAITMRGRTIINAATKDPIVADFENPSSSTERAFRLCGLPQPMVRGLTTPSGTPAAIEASTVVCYAAILRREYADGYVVRSRPSLIVRSGGYVSPFLDGYLNVFFDEPSNTVKAGDVLEIYRSQSIPGAVGDDVEPGATLYLVATRTVTEPDASLGRILGIVDSAVASAAGGPLGGLGRAAYTNPDLGGLSSVEDPPPVAACVAKFRGRAWYANCRLPARFMFAARRGVGKLDTPEERANGVGHRNVTGSISSGSTTVSDVSAAHMVGLVVGLKVSPNAGGQFPEGTYITSVGATSFTVNNAALTTAAAQLLRIYDLFDLDGDEIEAWELFSTGFGSKYIATSNASLWDAFSPGREWTIQPFRYVPPATLSIRATQGDKYDPPLPLMSEDPLTIQPTHAKNYVRYSKDQLPEAVPPTNELWVGTGEIYAMVPTRDALWFFCSDGLFRLSGTIAPIQGVPDIRVDPIDSTLILAGPRAFCVLRDHIYAYTSAGLVQISDAGIIPLSMGVVGDLLPGSKWVEAETPFLVADERVDEVYVMGAHATLNFVYSVRYGCFTTTAQFDGARGGVQLATSLAIIFSYASSVLDELQPDLTAPLTSGPVADFQPVFGDRPDLQKQWIDATYIFEAVSSGNIQPRFNEVVSNGFEALLDAGNDMRATVGVPQDAPAIGPSLAPGFRVETAGLKRITGISLRYQTFTEQDGRR